MGQTGGSDHVVVGRRAASARCPSTGTWHAKEAVREFYALDGEQLAAQWTDELIRDMNDPSWPIEVRSLGRILKRWRDQIIAWH